MKRVPLARSQPLRRGGGLRRRAPLAPESARRRREIVVYRRLRAAFLREHPLCQRCGVAPATDLHHKRGRGPYLLATDTYMACCRACHSWIGTHVEESYERGWMLRRVGAA